MLRTVNDQPTLWDAILPPELLVLPATLTCTEPVPTVDGIVAVICASDQLFTVRAMPPILIVLVPWLVPNPTP